MVQNRMASISPLRSKTEYRFEARTYFSDGSRGYDVMGFHKDQLITDILAQFERYLALVQSPEAQLLHNAPERAGLSGAGLSAAASPARASAPNIVVAQRPPFYARCKGMKKGATDEGAPLSTFRYG